ncbi:MAG: calcium-binding protein [Cypionkella sp.]|uniref:calcium-binding protein n=1 Tax=Cypionkella sp. TaxID=2811411 RepID=UPI002ABAF285|nr:calcium-binding protein [Cypionkella sp.]MDZ4311080.1 calcium-binding protein [Cypionkella sp.]
MALTSSIFLINSTASEGQYDPSVTVLRDGRIAVAWTDDSNIGNPNLARDIRARVLNADGSAPDADFKVNTEVPPETTAVWDSHYQFNSDITALANGGFAVAWGDTRASSDSSLASTTVMQLYTAGGALAGDNFNVTPGFSSPGNAIFANTPSIIGLANGTVKVVDDTSNFQILPSDPGEKVLLTTISSTGTVTGPIPGSGMGAGDQIKPQIIKLSNGNVAIAYLSNENNASHEYSLRVQIRNVAGVAVGSEVIVPNTKMLSNTSKFSIAALDDGRYVVTWQQEPTTDEFNSGLRTDVMAQVYGANGTPVGGIINVHSRDGLAQTLPVVAGQPDGSFLIVWQEGAGSSGGDYLRAQLYSSDGTAHGAMFSLGVEQGAQSDVDITITNDGRYLVVWEDRSTFPENPDGWGIRGQYVDPRESAMAWTGAGFAEQFVGTDFHDSLNGGGGNDTLWGGLGNDTFLFSTGADVAYGGAGNDTFYVSFGDQVFEAAGEGSADKLIARTNYVLADDQEVEILQVANVVTATPIQLRGNNLANQITGYTQADVLQGMAGNDTINGLSGDDTLSGGIGIDRLIGGAGADTFVLTKPAAYRDIIVDFAHDLDTLQISVATFGGGLVAGALGTAQFVANATGLATTLDQRFIYETDTGVLSFDTNGSAAGGSGIIATFVGLPTLSASDFELI